MKTLLKILLWPVELYMDVMDAGGAGFFLIMSVCLFFLFWLGAIVYKALYCSAYYCA